MEMMTVLLKEANISRSCPAEVVDTLPSVVVDPRVSSGFVCEIDRTCVRGGDVCWIESRRGRCNGRKGFRFIGAEEAGADCVRWCWSGGLDMAVAGSPYNTIEWVGLLLRWESMESKFGRLLRGRVCLLRMKRS